MQEKREREKERLEVEEGCRHSICKQFSRLKIETCFAHSLLSQNALLALQEAKIAEMLNVEFSCFNILSCCQSLKDFISRFPAIHFMVLRRMIYLFIDIHKNIKVQRTRYSSNSTYCSNMQFLNLRPIAQYEPCTVYVRIYVIDCVCLWLCLLHLTLALMKPLHSFPRKDEFSMGGHDMDCAKAWVNTCPQF